MTVYIDLELWR